MPRPDLKGLDDIPPAIVTATDEPFRLALDEGAIYIQGQKVNIVGALVSALVVKTLLFGGQHAARAAKAAYKRARS
jgi:hypothetical protein